MRNIARLFVLIFALMPVLAAAQSAPANLPARSVYGRLGIPGDTGPGQAIPFTTLGSLLASSLNGGTAKMFPHQSQTAVATDAYTALDPFGNAISCAGTHTQCLQEFLNVTTANGWPAVVACQGTIFPSGAEPVFIQANTSVTVPVSQDWSFHSYGCNLNFSVTTIPGLIFDSQGASVFDWDGKIVYNVTAPNGNTVANPSCVVYLNPTTNTADGFPGIYAGLIRIKSPVNNPLGGTKSTGVVCINAAGGSTIQGRLDFTEINANNNAYYGVLAFGATGSTGLMQTEININQIHGAFLHAIDIGFNSTNQANYNGNQWKVNNIENADTVSRGIDTYGSSDTFDIGVINAAQGGLGIGLVAESGATWNKFRYGSIAGYTTLDWSDAGTCNDFSGGNGVTGSSAGTKHVMAGGSSGCQTFRPAAAASGSVRWPAGTTDFSATGGASQVVKQVTTGAPFTVARLACSDLSNSGPDCAALSGQLPGTATNDNATAGNVGEIQASGLATATPGTATVTITIASPGVVTWTAHGLTGITPVVFTTSGALPTGITASTTYWTIPATTTINTFQVATSIANAIAGTAVITTGSQSGTQTGSNLVAATNNAPLNIAALSLTAGDWDVSGAINIDGAASTTVAYFTGSAGQTSATLNQGPSASFAQTYGGGTPFASLIWVTNALPVQRFSLSGTTTVYLVQQAGFAVSTMSANGFIRARRAR